MWAPHAVQRRKCDTQPDVAGEEAFVNDAALGVGKDLVVATGWAQVVGVGAWRMSKRGSAWAAYRTLAHGVAN